MLKIPTFEKNFLESNVNLPSVIGIPNQMQGGAMSNWVEKGLHLQHGPIDLIVSAEGASNAVASAYLKAADAFCDLLSELVALPAEGGLFPVADYVGPELAAFALAEPPACDEEDWIRQIQARLARSCHRVSPKEYAALVARLYKGRMAELFPSPADFILGLFGVWKVSGKSQRLLVDARPPNCLFDTPPFIHRGGDSISRMQVAADHDLLDAKADLRSY